MFDNDIVHPAAIIHNSFQFGPHLFRTVTYNNHTLYTHVPCMVQLIPTGCRNNRDSPGT